MGFFSRKNRVVDLTEDYKYDKKHPIEDMKVPSPTSTPAESQETSSGGFFNFFGNSNSSSSSSSSSNTSSSPYSSSSDSSVDDSSSVDSIGADEKRRRLAKRLKDMTDRIEEQSNQIYLLQQRIDLLDKKMKIGKYTEE
jgi:hypothetical protein